VYTLLSPLSVAGLTLRNRIVMPPMFSGFATPRGEVTDRIVDYHRLRAEAGTALIIVEHAYVHPWGRLGETQMSVADDAMIPGLARLAAAIKGEGAVACLQLAHAGASTNAAAIGRAPMGPMLMHHPFEKDADAAQAATPDEIGLTVRAFGDAAVRARDAGFDAVEIHAAHGYLLSHFLSPLTNTRTDEYGGNEWNRRRLHLKVLAEVRSRLGPHFPVFIRLGAADDTPGGLELEEAVRAAIKLTLSGVDLVDVSGGLQGSRAAVVVARGPGWFVPCAQAIKEAVNVPVLVTGGFTDPRHADRVVREGRADLIGVGRAMLNDPAWARDAIRTLSGQPDGQRST
jgi:2,4-dienoyl-CoA reductase-like NADH-dependent reductase (Old Yellow Enzyme family)